MGRAVLTKAGNILHSPLDILADRFGNQCRMYWPTCLTAIRHSLD